MKKLILFFGLLATLSVLAHQQSSPPIGPTPDPADNNTHQWCWPMGNTVTPKPGHSAFISWATSSFPSLGYTFPYFACGLAVAPYCNGVGCDIGLTVDVWMWYNTADAFGGGNAGEVGAYSCTCWDTTNSYCVRGNAVVDPGVVSDLASISTSSESDIEKTAWCHEVGHSMGAHHSSSPSSCLATTPFPGVLAYATHEKGSSHFGAHGTGGLTPSASCFGGI